MKKIYVAIVLHFIRREYDLKLRRGSIVHTAQNWSLCTNKQMGFLKNLNNKSGRRMRTKSPVSSVTTTDPTLRKMMKIFDDV